MRQKMVAMIFFNFILLTVLLPIDINAKTIDISDGSFIQTSEVIHSFAKNNSSKETKNTKIASCTGDDSLLGDVSNEDSVAWLLQKLFNYIKVLGPSLTIILSSIDYIKAIVSSDEKQMHKVNSNFVKRMIAAVMLFFIPTIIGVLFNIVGITTDCGIS